MRNALVMTAACLLFAGGFVGCSKQTSSDTPSGEPATSSSDDRRDRRSRGDDSAEDDEPELTEEELEAQRREEAQSELSALLEEYEAGNADIDQLEDKLQDIIDRLPNNPEAWFNLGLARYKQDNQDGAIDAWQKAGEVDPEFARGMASIGALELERGNREEAEEIFNQCLERSSTEPGCNINLAIMYRKRALEDGELTQEEAQRSIDRLRFALVGDAKNAPAYDNLARIYYDLGQLDLAQLVCENAILQGIDAAILHNRLGLIALAQNDVIRAYREFQAAVERDDSMIDAWMNIGAMALSFRDYEAAKEAFARVLELRDGWNEAKMSYGVALRGVGQIEQAREQYEAVLAEEPNNLAAIFNLGVLYQEGEQNYEQALEYYRQFQEKNDDPDSELAEEVANRITNLEDLIKALEEFGEL
jgi:tetratricopeptide (TPR) repeat protein